MCLIFTEEYVADRLLLLGGQLPIDRYFKDILLIADEESMIRFSVAVAFPSLACSPSCCIGIHIFVCGAPSFPFVVMMVKRIHNEVI